MDGKSKYPHIVFHVKLLYILIVTLGSFRSFSQGSILMKEIVINYSLPEDADLRESLNQTVAYSFLNQREQDVVYYLNYARQNPHIFLKNAINTFILNHPEVKSSYTLSLQKAFGSMNELPIIFPDVSITKVSRLHALDLSTHNTISHKSTDGRTFQDRVGPFMKGCGSESIHAAQKFNALEAVLSLLFDFNVPDLGHRKSLLDPRFSRAGYGVSVNPKEFFVLVIDFSCQ